MINFQGEWPPNPETVTFYAEDVPQLNDRWEGRGAARRMGNAVGTLLGLNLANGSDAQPIINALASQIESVPNSREFAVAAGQVVMYVTEHPEGVTE